MSHRSDASIMDRLAPRTNGSQDRFAVRAVFCVPGGLSSGHGSPCRMAAPNRRSAHSFPNGGKRLPPRTSLPSSGTKHAAGSVSPALLKNHGTDINLGPVWPVRGIFPIHTTLVLTGRFRYSAMLSGNHAAQSFRLLAARARQGCLLPCQGRPVQPEAVRAPPDPGAGDAYPSRLTRLGVTSSPAGFCLRACLTPAQPSRRVLISLITSSTPSLSLAKLACTSRLNM